MGDAGDRKHLWLMENGKSSPTLGKLDELARALNFDPVTLLALCVSVRDQVSPSEVIERVQQELAEFEKANGLEQLALNAEGGADRSRTNERQRKLAAVQDCKRQGLTQKETVDRLGIPKSTVHDLWKIEDLGSVT
jgi:transcriptional regulator with XRE-family HTH domain